MFVFSVFLLSRATLFVPHGQCHWKAAKGTGLGGTFWVIRPFHLLLTFLSHSCGVLLTNLQFHFLLRYLVFH